MGGRAAEEDPSFERPRTLEPPLGAALGLTLIVFLLLLSNGRPIGAGDTRPTERLAASLVQEGDLDLDEYPEVEPPFSRPAGGHRRSVYPALSAVLAAPVFALAGVFFALDEAGSALAGKLAASLFSALAAGALFLAVARRHPEAQARWTAFVFALGTSVWSTSQALWQHPAAVLVLSIAVLWIERAEDEPAWASRAALPLSLAVAARHADLALAGVMAAGIALRWPRRIPAFLLWGLPGAAFVFIYDWIAFGSPLRHGFSGTLGRFSEPWGVGHLGLLLSPGKGLLVFTPVAALAAVGLIRAHRKGERWLTTTLGAAVLAHWLLMGRWSEWHGGESWGPRMMTDALPLLFVFLPDGMDALPRLGALTAALAVAVQALGAFAHDYTWERLHQRPAGAAGHSELWDLAKSPIAFYARRRVVIASVPAVRGGRAFIREHPVVVMGPSGSRVSFEGPEPSVGGAARAFGDVHLQRGARVENGRLRLRGRWDGLFLRVRPEARSRRLELRIAGRGRGTLYVGEKTFWTEPRWTAHPMAGPFRVRHPYHFPESGGADVTVTLGRAAGEAEIDSLRLVPPSEPEGPPAG